MFTNFPKTVALWSLTAVGTARRRRPRCQSPLLAALPPPPRPAPAPPSLCENNDNELQQ